MLKEIKKRINNILIKKMYGYVIYQYYRNFASRPKRELLIKDIVICGMQRSGSTLIYNYVKEILKYRSENANTFCGTDSEYFDLLEDDYSILVKKVHGYSPHIASRIKKKKSIGIFTHRDIRDVLLSSIQKGWLENYNEWIENNQLKKIMFNAILYSRVKNVLCLSYEEIMESPHNSVIKIAEKLNIQLTTVEIARIVEKYSITNVKKQLKDLPESLKLKYENQFHKNHIADSRIGKWQGYFSVEDKNEINSYIKKYNKYFGYSDGI